MLPCHDGDNKVVYHSPQARTGRRILQHEGIDQCWDKYSGQSV